MSAIALPVPRFDWRSFLRAAQRQRSLMTLRSPLAAKRQVSSPLASGAGAGITTIVNCTFNTIDGTLVNNYPWTDPADVRPGINQWSVGFSGTADGLDILSNRAHNKAGLSLEGNVIETGVSDCTILADASTGITGTVSDGQGIQFRFVDPNNCWIIRKLKSTNDMRLVERIGGSNLVRATAPYPYTANTPYAMVIVLSGQTITCTFGTTSIVYTSSSHQAATKHGIELLNPAIPTAYIDNFKVTIP